MKLLDSIKMVGAALLLAVVAWGTLWFVATPIESPAPQAKRYYVRIAAVYEGDIDWRFYVTTKMLEAMAPQMFDKPMLLGHDWADPNVCVGRIVDSAVKEDKYGHYLEVIVLINDERAADMIARRAYSAVSIGFSKIKAICQIDGKTDCEHEPGHKYQVHGAYMIARFVLQEVKMHEVSFINVPASEHARVLELANHPLRCSTSK